MRPASDETKSGGLRVAECVKSNYENETRVTLTVSCGRGITHFVGHLQSNAEYRVEISGEPEARMMRSTADGVIVFYNPGGKNVIITLKEEAR